MLGHNQPSMIRNCNKKVKYIQFQISHHCTQTIRARELNILEMCHRLGVLCHVSCVTCQVSLVRCHMSWLIFLLDKLQGLVGGGSFINGFINFPVVSNADNILSRSLDRKFGSRKKWNFKSGDTKYYTSAVVDKKKLESSRLKKNII